MGQFIICRTWLVGRRKENDPFFESIFIKVGAYLGARTNFLGDLLFKVALGYFKGYISLEILW